MPKTPDIARAGSSLSIRYPVVLLPYAVVLVAMLVYLIDSRLFDGYLSFLLPANPEKAVAFSIFLGLPHIVGSSISLFDRHYARHYAPSIGIGLALLSAPFLLLPGHGALFWPLYYAWTVFHVIGQQFGIGRLFLRTTDMRLYRVWSWLGVAIGAIVFFGLFSPGSLHVVPPWGTRVVLLGAVVLFSAIGAVLFRFESHEPGWGLILGNLAMMLSTAFFFVVSEPFFAVLIPRVIHDLSAFHFYAVHDHNRNTHIRHNLLYRVLPLPTGRMRMLVTPMLAILIAAPLTWFKGDNDVVMNLVLGLGLFHYLLERTTWRRSGLHRSQLRIGG